MPTFADVKVDKDELWRKAQATIIAIAPYSTTALTTILDSTDGTLKALPTGWTQLGKPTQDGISWPRSADVSQLLGLGSTGPGRSDIRSVTKQVSFTLMETNRAGLELAQGIDLSTASSKKVPASTGNSTEVTWDEPELPDYPYMRLIAIARDMTVSGEMYIGRELLRCRVTDIGDETWNNQDQSIGVGQITLDAFFDDTAGTAMRHFRGGPGYTELVELEGFSTPS